MTTLETDTTTSIDLSKALKSLNTHRTIAIVLLSLSAAYWAIEAYASFSSNLSDGFIDFVIGVESVYPLLMVATAAAFIAWSYRAHANLALMGRTGMNHKNQATIWWWIVPVANLWMPYRVLYETVRGSRAPAGDTDWRNHTLGGTTIWWTVTFIAGLIATRAAAAAIGGATTFEDFQAALAVNGVASLIMIAAAVTAITMITETRDDQEHMAAQMNTATTSTYPDVRDDADMWATID